MQPFKKRNLTPVSFMDKMMKRLPSANCMIELENILANASDPEAIPETLLAELSIKYKVDLHEKYLDRLKGLYSNLILYALSDKQFDEEEATAIFKLQTVFGFPDQLHNQLYEEVAERVYRKSVKEALLDNVVTDEEKQKLAELSRRLELPDGLQNKLTVEETGGFLTGKMKEALSDGMLSPEEEKAIKQLANQMGINLTYDSKTKSQLVKARLMWQIAHGDVPVLDVGITLRKNETCHFTTPIVWHEMRKITKRIQYGGPQLRIKICKGLYWKAGDYAVRAISEDVMKVIDSGDLFLTNKRIIFMGATKNTSIALNKILDFTPHLDGVMIQKDTGKSPFFGFNSNQDVFCAVLARMINDTLV